MHNPELPPALQARFLIQHQLFGVLSSFSLKEKGFPYGSITPFCLDPLGQPILLISDLAQHTHNLRANPKAALTVFSGHQAEEQHASKRLCILTIAEFVSDAETDQLASRYARYFPESPDIRMFRDFHFLRLQPYKVHLVAGFGQIKWFEGQDILCQNQISVQQEQAFVEDINTDQDDFLAACWVALTGKSSSSSVALIGIDTEGGDLRSGTQRRRFYFSHPIQDLRQAWEHLKRAAILSAQDIE